MIMFKRRTRIPRHRRTVSDDVCLLIYVLALGLLGGVVLWHVAEVPRQEPSPRWQLVVTGGGLSHGE